MQICINKVYDRMALIKNINTVTSCGLVKAKHKVDDIDQGTKLTIDVPDEYLIIFKTICQFTTESKRYNMEKNQFKPFDKVLVRSKYHECWRVSFFSHLNNTTDRPFCCINGSWTECIPYNENTAHLLGTNQPYKEPEPKVWYINSIKNGESYKFTNDEFEHFIKTAVLNNKDITDFNVRYVNN